MTNFRTTKLPKKKVKEALKQKCGQNVNCMFMA